jgi:uncharacterized membrane protein affecting hemolysin expression
MKTSNSLGNSSSILRIFLMMLILIIGLTFYFELSRTRKNINEFERNFNDQIANECENKRKPL